MSGTPTGPHGNRILSDIEVDGLLRERPASAVAGSPNSNSATFSHYASETPITCAASSVATLWNSDFSPFRKDRIREIYAYDEYSLYEEYRTSYRTNPFTFMLVEYVVSSIFGDGITIVGEGKEEVLDFFYQDDTENKLEMFVRDGVLYGNGILGLVYKGSKVVATEPIAAEQIMIRIEDNEHSDVYGKRQYYQAGVRDPLNDEALIHLMLREQPFHAYGMSVLRPNLFFLQGLFDAGGDVFSALKRIGYAPLVAKLDLDGFKKEEDKEDALKRFTEKMKQTESAAQNFAIDRRHDINLLGIGSVGARLLPMNDMITPILSVCLRNFGFPIGAFLQEGANFATLNAQKEDARLMISAMRNRFKRTVEKGLFRKITKKRAEIAWKNPPIFTEEGRETIKSVLLAYQYGIVSKEYVRSLYFPEDRGDEFFLNPVPEMHIDTKLGGS